MLGYSDILILMRCVVVIANKQKIRDRNRKSIPITMSQQQEEIQPDSIEYIRDNQCRAINERAAACVQQQDSSEECRRSCDDLFVCVTKIKYVVMELKLYYLY